MAEPINVWISKKNTVQNHSDRDSTEKQLNFRYRSLVQIKVRIQI